MSPTSTSGDASTTGLTLSYAPSVNAYASVLVNGWLTWLAYDDTERAAADCYFSDDGGTTAKAANNLAAGDVLYWNGLNTGFDLINGTHFVDFLYDRAG